MKTALKFILVPLTVWAVMIGFAFLDRIFGWHGVLAPRTGWLLILIGAAMGLWCAGLFRVVGHGTPHPFVLKTKKLVIRGPYQYVRNPMMWAFGMIIAGAALATGLLGLWLGLAVFGVFAIVFVQAYEEQDMLRRFGDEYREYCQQVPRWLPRIGPRPAMAARR